MGILSQIGSFLGFGRQTVSTQAPVKVTMPDLAQLEVAEEVAEVPAIQEKVSTFQAAESKVAEPYTRRFPGC